MGLPAKLKNMNLFNNGLSYIGQVDSVTLPKLTRKREAYRGGGMNGEVKLDMGMEAIDFEWQCGGFMVDVMKQFGITTTDGLQLRFAGAYQADDTGEVTAVEILVHGSHEEIDGGDAKVGDATEFKVKTNVSYYKLTVDGVDVVEIDFVNFIEIVDGVDMLADIRAAMGV